MLFTKHATLNPDPDPDPDPEEHRAGEHRAGEHTEKRSAGRAGEHKGRERGQASGKVSFFLGVRLPFAG